MKEEIWKDIAGYEGIYQVSSLGKVRSLSRLRKGKRGSPTHCEGKCMTLQKMRNGYLQVSLSNGHKAKVYLVHRLVAMMFIPNPLGLKCVDHINGVRDDNRLYNLRWCSHSENLSFPRAKNNISESQKRSEKCRKHWKEMVDGIKRAIIIVFPSGDVIEYPSAKDAEKDGFNHSLIAACCRGKQKTHRNCRCYYKEDYYGG